MKTNDLKEQLTQKIYRTAEKIITQKAAMLKELIRYEIAVTNTELALISDGHGYDFKFLSDDYANNITLSPVQTENGSVNMRVMIPKHAYKNASDNEVEFFNTYVLANALTKLKRTV